MLHNEQDETCLFLDVSSVGRFLYSEGWGGGGGPCTMRAVEVGPELGPGGEVPFMASFEISWVMVTWNPPNRMTDTTENITFPQLSRRAVMISHTNSGESSRHTLEDCGFQL